MTAEPVSSEQEPKRRKVVRQGGASEVVYGMGLIGAWVITSVTPSQYGSACWASSRHLLAGNVGL